MNKRSEQELFLNYIRDIYLAYPSLEINDDTIYNELSHFYEENGIRKRIGNNGLLLNVQQSLAKNLVLNLVLVVISGFMKIEKIMVIPIIIISYMMQ